MKIATNPFGFINQPLGYPVGNRTYADKVKSLFGSSLIQYLPMNESPAGNNYLTFNGSTTIVNCGSGASLDNLPGGGVFTLDGWINPTATGTTRYFFSKGSSLRFGLNNANQVAAWLTEGTNTIYNIRGGSGWMHVALYFNGTTGIRIAVNGLWNTLATNASFNAATYDDSASNVNFGGASGTASYTGEVGWFRVSNNDRLTAGTNFTGSIPARTTIPTVDANTVSLWPMNENYGTVAGDIGANNNDGTITNGDWGAYPVAVDYSGQGNDGAYTGVTLANAAAPMGGFAPYFDAVNDYNNIYSAGLNTAFNGQLFSAVLFMKVPSGVWTDGTQRTVLNLNVDGNNYLSFVTSSTNNRVSVYYDAGGTWKGVNQDGLSTTDWFMMSASVDLSGDAFKGYFNASQMGATQTGLGTWAGSLSSNHCVVGAYDVSNTQPYGGWAAHYMLINRVVTQPEMLLLKTWAGVA